MSRNVPNINASLIREARMIFQQLFGNGRVDNYYSMRAAEAKAKADAEVNKAPKLQCSICFFTKTVADKAVTIIDGNALCIHHAVQHGAPKN